MELALIPPASNSMLGYAERHEMQLVLPHLTDKKNYYDFMLDMQGRGDYLILDNGAAEGRRTSDAKLVRLAQDLHVSEVALPDVLYNASETLQRVRNILDDQPLLLSHDRPFNLGFVAQGHTLVQAKWLINRVVQSVGAEEVLTTVYLPRLLVTNNDFYARLTMAEWIHKKYPELQIHMFGTSRLWPKEVLAIKEECPYVRSIDTSAPFVYAQAGMVLDAPALNGLEEGPARREDYFKLTDRDFRANILTRNVELIEGWVTSGDRTKAPGGAL